MLQADKVGDEKGMKRERSRKEAKKQPGQIEKVGASWGRGLQRCETFGKDGGRTQPAKPCASNAGSHGRSGQSIPAPSRTDQRRLSQPGPWSFRAPCETDDSTATLSSPAVSASTARYYRPLLLPPVTTAPSPPPFPGAPGARPRAGPISRCRGRLSRPIPDATPAPEWASAQPARPVNPSVYQ